MTRDDWLLLIGGMMLGGLSGALQEPLWVTLPCCAAWAMLYVPSEPV